MTKELIRNGGFERGNLDFWVCEAGSAEIVSDVKENGYYSAKVITGSSNYALFSTNDWIEVASFELYRILLWLKSVSWNSVESLIWFYDSDYNYISGNYILILKKTGSFDWTKFELFFAVPSEASFMRLGLKPLGTQGSYGYIDSVSLIEIPANRVGFAPVHAVHVKDLYNKGTFYGSEIYTGIWHYADYVLFVDYLGTTNANPITLDVTVQSYDNETGQWFDCVVFDTVEAPDDSHPVNDKTYVKVATAGLGYKQRVKYVVGGSGTVDNVSFDVGVTYKR